MRCLGCWNHWLPRTTGGASSGFDALEIVSWTAAIISRIERQVNQIANGFARKPLFDCVRATKSPTGQIRKHPNVGTNPEQFGWPLVSRHRLLACQHLIHLP
jgi:hypothetical protein